MTPWQLTDTGLPLSRRTLLALAAGAVSTMSARAAPASRGSVEVIHWWTGGSESDSIRVLRRAVEAAGYVWIDTPVQGPDLAKTAAITRVLGGKPPAMMGWHAGPDLPGLLRDGAIRDIESVAGPDRWDALLPSGISDRLKADGKYVAAPIDLHAGNAMFANLKLLKAAGLEVPVTWPAVVQACERLKSSGSIPIAFAGQAWQEASVFVQIISGTGGANLLRRFAVDHDLDAAGGPEMAACFETFGRLRPFVDKGNPNRGATDTAGLVSSDRAALYFSGDWSKGELTKAGMTLGVDFVCRPGPGNDGIFVAVVDVFCMPRDVPPETRVAQDDLARLIMSTTVQHDFNLIKGSIPIRNDVGLAGYDAAALEAARLSRGAGEVVPAVSMGMTTAMRSAFYDVVHRFWNTEDADPRAAAKDLRIAIERNRI